MVTLLQMLTFCVYLWAFFFLIVSVTVREDVVLFASLKIVISALWINFSVRRCGRVLSEIVADE